MITAISAVRAKHSPASNTDRSGDVVLDCIGVSARYGAIQVCFDISLHVERGETLVVLGPNGAGKSSLLGAIAGSVRGGGEVGLMGRDVSRLSASDRAACGIAFVPEARGNIFPTLSVRENLELGLRMVPASEKVQARAFLLDLFPILADRLSAAAGMMSGGEQQMLAVAMAAARRPAVILLDEPTQGLAPVIYDHLEQAFIVLKREGAALLVAEQNLPFVKRIADRFVVLSEGRLTFSGGADDLSKEDAVVASFFGAASTVSGEMR